MPHFLNPFPDLLIFSIFAPLILRLTLGYFFISFASAKFSPGTNAKWKPLGILEVILGICFILGFGVQIDSLISIIILGGTLLTHDRENFPKLPRIALWLLLIMSVSLLVSGAGLPAIDLPL